MSDFSSVNSGVPPGTAVAPPPVGAYEPYDPPAKAHWTGSSGLVIAVVALVLVILVIILMFVWPSNCNSGGSCSSGGSWKVLTGTATTASFVGGNNTIYANRAAGAVALTITTPGGPTGQTFIIDNQSTTGSGDITLTLPSGVSLVGSAVVTKGTSAQFVWVSSTEAHRYWISS